MFVSLCIFIFGFFFILVTFLKLDDRKYMLVDILMYATFI